MNNSERILNLIYKTYGSNSGVLFGIENRESVKAIIEFTERYLDRHKDPPYKEEVEREKEENE